MKPIFFVAIIVFLASCTKSASIDNSYSAFPQNYMSRMGGTRTWTGVDQGVTFDSVTGQQNGSFYQVLNYTFPLQIDNNAKTVTSINFGKYETLGGVFRYDSAALDTSAKTMLFQNSHGTCIYYYYAKDSIVFYLLCNTCAGPYIEDGVLQTP